MSCSHDQGGVAKTDPPPQKINLGRAGTSTNKMCMGYMPESRSTAWDTSFLEYHNRRCYSQTLIDLTLPSADGEGECTNTCSVWNCGESAREWMALFRMRRWRFKTRCSRERARRDVSHLPLPDDVLHVIACRLTEAYMRKGLTSI